LKRLDISVSETIRDRPNIPQTEKADFLMTTTAPSVAEIKKLVSFLPRLYAKGFTPVQKWGGASEHQDGSLSLPWPEYDPLVIEFFQIASQECWTDYDYDIAITEKNLNDESAVKRADLDLIKAMLTYCVRGEKFCDGHWGAMVEEGQIRRVLERLDQLQ
jgi:hypothetical protein